MLYILRYLFRSIQFSNVKIMKIFNHTCLFLISLITFNLNSQITIGETPEPAKTDTSVKSKINFKLFDQIIGAFNSAGFPKQALKGWNQDCCKNSNDSNSYQNLQQRYTGSLSYGQKNSPKAKYFHRNSYSCVKSAVSRFLKKREPCSGSY